MLFMISCQEASQLVSHQVDRPLSLKDRLRLRFHLLLCKACPTLHRKFETLHRAGQQYILHDEACGNECPDLSPEAKERIAKSLRQEKDSDEAERR